MDAITILIPLALITFLSIMIYVQAVDFNDRIANIATLMIVFVGLFPVIRDSIPPTNFITCVDLIV